MVGRYQIEALRFGQARGLFTGLVEIPAKLDDLAAKAAHGVVLFYGIAHRHHNQCPQALRPGSQG
ncbi:hypothetical protein D3C80_1826260 [compost metagenome]